MIILAILWLWLMKSDVKAVDSTDYSISPIMSEVMVGGDQDEKKIVLKITNNQEADVGFQVTKVDFKGLDESGGIAFIGMDTESSEKKYGLASWIVLPKDYIVVKAKSTDLYEATIVNRENMSPGGHYGAIIFIVDATKEWKNQVGVREAFSTLVLAKKIGGEKYGLVVKEIEQENQEIKVKFQNIGNVHTIVRGKVEVVDGFGRIVKTGILNQDSKIIYPETIKTMSVKLNQLVKILWPGKYTVRVNYRYGVDENFTFKTIEYFEPGYWWIILSPLPIILLIITVKRHK